MKHLFVKDNYWFDKMGIDYEKITLNVPIVHIFYDTEDVRL